MKSGEKIRDEVCCFLQTVVQNITEFFGNADIHQIAAYIEGYQFCIYNQSGYFSPFHEEFNSFVRSRLAENLLSGQNKKHWSNLIEEYCKKQRESEQACFQSLLSEYLKLTDVVKPVEQEKAHWIGIQLQQADPLAETFAHNSAVFPSKIYHVKLQKEHACVFQSGVLTGFYFTKEYLLSNHLSVEMIHDSLRTIPIAISDRPIWIEFTNKWFALRFHSGFETDESCYAYLFLIMSKPLDYSICIGEETLYAANIFSLFD